MYYHDHEQYELTEIRSVNETINNLENLQNKFRNYQDQATGIYHVRNNDSH